MERTINDTIEELKAVQKYFEETNNGACPVCILEAIKILNSKDDLVSRSYLLTQFGYTDDWYKSRTVAGIIEDEPSAIDDILKKDKL